MRTSLAFSASDSRGSGASGLLGQRLADDGEHVERVAVLDLEEGLDVDVGFLGAHSTAPVHRGQPCLSLFLVSQEVLNVGLVMNLSIFLGRQCVGHQVWVCQTDSKADLRSAHFIGSDL